MVRARPGAATRASWADRADRADTARKQNGDLGATRAESAHWSRSQHWSRRGGRFRDSLVTADGFYSLLPGGEVRFELYLKV